MSFLQPSILWGLPLLLIPVIIHLLNRLRHRPQPWAAMQFLRAANQSSISQAKLRQFLVLLLRVLGVAALVLFVSRPLAGGWLGWALAPAPEVIVLVLDRSASMETHVQNTGKTRREEAIRLWTEALGVLQQSSRLVLLDSTTRKPQELAGVGALSQAAFTGATDTRADIPALLRRAYTYLSESRSGAAEVWIASDLQESNWAPGDTEWERVTAQFAALPQKVRFRLLSFPANGPRNLSASLVEAVRRSRNDQRQLAVTVDLQETEASTEPVVLRWNIGGSTSQSEIKMDGQSLRWRYSFPLPRANEPGWGVIETGADANAADNKLFFAYDIERSPSALIVTARPNDARMLQLAGSDLASPSPERARMVAPEEFAGAVLTNTALIVWHSGAMPGAAPDILLQFASSGGAVLMLPDANSSGGTAALELAGLGFGNVSTSKPDAPFTVGKWNELEGPLAKTEEGFGVPMQSLEVHQRAAISGEGGVLGSFTDGAPFLVRKAVGKGEVYFCATSVGPAWSSLGDGSVLVPMIQRMINMGAKRVNTGVMMECGEVTAVESAAWTLVSTGDASVPSAGSAADPLVRAGVYKAGGRFVAVNRPAAENDLQRISGDSARKLFANLPFRMQEEQGKGTDRLQGEVWRFFLTLMLLFLVLEGFLILPTGGREEKRPVAAQPRRPAEAVA